jgi:hypothetical protein
MASNSDGFKLVEVLVISFLLCLYVTGIFAFVGFVFPTHRIIPQNYYQLKDPDRLVRIYDSLGLNYFKNMLLFLFWGRRKNKTKYFNGLRSGIENFRYKTKQSEFGHLAALISILIISVMLFWKGYVLLTIWMNILNLFGNLYPILLQRYHRMRIEKLFSK